MSKKKKIIISISVVVAIIVIGVVIFLLARQAQESANENKLAKMRDRMMQSQNYQISFTLNDDNHYTVSRSGDMVNVDNYNSGNHTTDIVKDGNTYLLMYNTQMYYTYQNNTTEVNELPNALNDIIQSQEPEKGEEEIDGKKYRYEEYKGTSYFLLDMENQLSEDETNTRFYFDGDDLKYIRTIMGEESELIQVDVSYTNVDSNLFEIPEEFEEG